MDSLVSLRVFSTVAELRSFTSAAARLGLSPAMASKHVMRLEERLGVRLLNRTSRHVSPTEAGAAYFEETRRLLEDLDAADAAVSRSTQAPRGRLRMSAPVWMANPQFASMLADYRARYPEVSLEVDLSGRVVNLVEEGFDLALRATAQPGPGLIARAVADVAFQLVGAPAFLDRTGRPAALDDLQGKPLLAYSLVHSDGVVTLGPPEARRPVKFAPVLVSGNETLMHLAAMEGMGLALLPKWLIADDVACGRLELVLPGVAVGAVGRLLAVYPSRKYLSAKVRTFLDFIVADPRMR
jgi:DNA-binding transcriptional LysR family regulator